MEDAPLRELVARGEIVDLEPGEVLIREGDQADALFVVLDGELEVTRRSGESRIPLAVVGPGSLQGEIAALEGGRRLASVAALREAEVLRIPVEALRELLATGPDVALSVVRTAVARLRAMESTLREREKLAALGTLSAGLAHELNNPAAAALRSVAALEEAVHAAESLPRPSPPPRPPADTPPPRSALDRADRISELEAVAGSAEAANALVEAGWTAAALGEQPPDVVPWLAADASVRQLLGELEIALTRIRDIVGAVKGYTYLDQAPVGQVDVRIGLEQTLVILRHRLRDIDVRTRDRRRPAADRGIRLRAEPGLDEPHRQRGGRDGRPRLADRRRGAGPHAGGDRGAGHDRRLGFRHSTGHPRPALRAVLHHQGARARAPGSGSTSRTA